MPVAIKIENLSKQYRLGLVSTRTLSHDLNRWWNINIRGKDDPYLKVGETNDRSTKGKSDLIWALKDINLEVRQGEVLGIIGKNGAGKSTLLKILAKVTSPTTGTIKTKGRIASLLEVGTGFHPEMTGRENIFMNGVVLGMTKSEIRVRFDEIVDFSGVERYIDTPVKRYSSGMMVRLGFAVAAHLEPKILIVDEVLAVGDAEFQKKAIGKMQNVSRSDGRTVLFVSHNMGSVLRLCGNCVLLSDGLIAKYGPSEKIVEEYYNNSVSEIHSITKEGDKDIYLKQAYTCNSEGELQASFAHSEDIHLRLKIGINKYSDIQNIGICLLKQDKKRVFTVNRALKDFYKQLTNEIEVDFIIEGGLIAPMNYSFLVALNNRSGHITFDYYEDICPIIVYDDGTDFAFAEGIDYGCIILKDKWALINN